MDFNFDALLQQVTNPTVGLQIVTVLVLLNVFLGVLVARKDGTFNRAYLLAFLETRFLYQLLPIAATGFGAIYLKMPVLSWAYAVIAVAVAGDLFADIKAKLAALFGRRS